MGGQESLGSSVSFFLFGYFTGVPSLDCDSVSIVANIMGKILNLGVQIFMGGREYRYTNMIPIKYTFFFSH